VDLNPRTDPYAELGVRTDASRAEVVRAYRRLARASHPDAHPGDPAAPARFRALTTAYQLLADDARRAAYDARHLAVPPERVVRPGPVFGGDSSMPIRVGPVHVGFPPDRYRGESISPVRTCRAVQDLIAYQGLVGWTSTWAV
jgi:curved DNA-binding protein CbpA